MRLPYRTPFSWPKLLAFFAYRATPGVEEVDGDTYRRTLAPDGRHVIIEVCPEPGATNLQLTVHGADPEEGRRISKIAQAVFDLDAPIAEISKVLKRDSRLRSVLRDNTGVRVPGAWDGFELTVRAILGQQVSVKAATTLAGRIAARYGEPLQLDAGLQPGKLSRIFPSAVKLSRARFNNIGLVRSRAATIRNVASAMVRGDLSFDTGQDTESFCRQMTAIRGIGDWTAQYVAMRVLKDPDAFPASDLGLMKAAGEDVRLRPKELSAMAEAWRPWRAYAALLLWNSLAGSGG